MEINYHQECEAGHTPNSTNDDRPSRFLALERGTDIDFNEYDIQAKEGVNEDKDKEEKTYEGEEGEREDDDMGIEEERRRSYHICEEQNRCKTHHRKGSKRYREITKLTIELTIHFFAVLLVLFGSAVVFAYLEDGEYLLAQQSPKFNSRMNRVSTTTSSKTTLNTTMLLPPEELFLKTLDKEFNISMTIHQRDRLAQKLKSFIEKEKYVSVSSTGRAHGSKMHIFQKWFYFVVISASTIGYGDLYPKTENGKIFFICFSIVGIVLFMSLLKRAGYVICASHRKVFGIINTVLCHKGKEIVSKEVLSLFSLFMIFCGYLVAGISYGYKIAEEMKNWSLLDTIYFWIVTFTTVGFGDMTYSLHIEMEYMPFFVLYRVFGLALIAAIIDAISACFRNEKIKQKKETLRNKLRELRDEVVDKAELALCKVDAVLAKAEEALI